MAGEATAGRRRGDRWDRRGSEVEFGRIVAFSDGVMAIAITLLTLNLDVPRVASGDSSALAEGLLDLSPHFFAYALSFAVIGRLWLVHHRFFATLQSFDGTLMTSNLLYLALIVLVPFSSDVLGTYGEDSVAVMLYAATLGLAATVNALMIRYALRHELVGEAARSATAPFGSRRALLIPGAFLASIPVALLNPYVAQALWLLAFVGLARQRRASRA
jgi:uncharacterized membrane protein